MDRWIRVEDEMPPMAGYQDGTTDRVLVYMQKPFAPRRVVAFGEWSEDGFRWYFDDRAEKSHRVSHWMPLPEPPKREWIDG